jgi:hypothetical protein
LEPVVEQDRGGASCDRGANAAGAIVGDPAGSARGVQQRFVTDRKCVMTGGIDPNGPM